jgi:lipopolysaccharide export system permease protein
LYHNNGRDKLKILDKYIITELLWPFLFGVATFTILFFAGGQMTVVTKLIAEGGASISEAFSYAFNTLPAIFVLTFPMAVLLSSLLAFGRLSGESELVAMKAGGISFFRAALPAILFSAFITLTVFYLNNYISPDATYKSRNIFINRFLKTDESIAENITIREIQEDGIETVIFFKKLLIKENKMENVTVQYFKGNVRIREIFADEAIYRPDIGKWYLLRAHINVYDKNQESQYDASSQEIIMPLNKSPQQLSSGRDRRHEEMSLEMVQENIVEMEKNLAKMKANNESADDIAQLQKRINLFRVSYQEKLAIPFTCLVFGLFGIPLGVRPHRTSKAFGLGLSIVFIFVYYVLMNAGHTLGEHGHMSPIWSAWTPNLLFGVSGILLIIKQTKE